MERIISNNAEAVNAPAPWPGHWLNRLANPIDSIEKPAFALFKEMCGMYEFSTDPWREKMRKVLEALINHYDTDWDKHSAYLEMCAMYADTLEDARLGRGEAELENWTRDSKAKKEGV
jgi:hypothetical protein